MRHFYPYDILQIVSQNINSIALDLRKPVKANDNRLIEIPIRDGDVPIGALIADGLSDGPNAEVTQSIPINRW